MNIQHPARRQEGAAHRASRSRTWPLGALGSRAALRLLVMWLLCIPGAQVLAHHSFAMYDTTRVVTLRGTIKEFQWTNPHALIWLNAAPDASGQSAVWSIELPTSPGNLTRLGWNKRSLKPGDVVEIDINPLRDGRRGGSFKQARVANGVVLTATPPSAAGAPAPGARP